MILGDIQKLGALLSKSERAGGFRLMLMILLMGVLDVIGVASIMPFMAVVAEPQIIETNGYLQWIYARFNFTSTKSFIGYLGICVFITTVFSMCFKALTQFCIYRFSFAREHSISEKLIRGYLNQPYSWFLNQHSADLGKSILYDVREVISRCLISVIMIVSHAVVSLLIVGMLIIVNPLVAGSVFLVFGCVYSLLFYGVSSVLNRIGLERLESNNARYKLVSEAFNAIKDVKILGIEDRYSNHFSDITKRFVASEVIMQSIGNLPRYAIEMVTFGGMILFILLNLSNDLTLSKLIPIISLYAFAIYRLMPSLQGIFAMASFFKSSVSVLRSVHAKYSSLQKIQLKPVSVERMSLTKCLRLSGVSFSYEGTDSQALTALDMEIPAKSIVGIIGSTGSGKTTTVDLLLGLLTPNLGRLEVDGVSIDQNNVRQWQQGIGYVPQQIVLIDESIAKNIAFGISDCEIDIEALIIAAKIANIHEFISDQLPDGYETKVGDKGVRLSGGQRQRIGIARALYHRPNILILDEATSALDNETEKAVMDAVNNLGREITIVMIAHRLSTLCEADIIYEMEDGRMYARGGYGEFMALNRSRMKTVAP